MASYGKLLTTNFSCPDNDYKLDNFKTLIFSHFLYSETFKALCHPRAANCSRTFTLGTVHCWATVAKDTPTAYYLRLITTSQYKERNIGEV